jgi:hypothetical protein
MSMILSRKASKSGSRHLERSAYKCMGQSNYYHVKHHKETKDIHRQTDKAEFDTFILNLTESR